MLNHYGVVQFKQLNVITVLQSLTDYISQMITMAESTREHTL